ncbi:hypothetical protein Agub_g15502, partial [Astrephomene gubernaculifera]
MDMWKPPQALLLALLLLTPASQLRSPHPPPAAASFLPGSSGALPSSGAGKGGGSSGGPSSSSGIRSAAAEGLASGGAAGGGGGEGGGGGICTDTCPLARNGVCEDGSPVIQSSGGNSRSTTAGGIQVACDLGTDCTDCGPYRGVVPEWGTSGGFKGPIDYLNRRGVRVWARRLAFPPHFVMAYTDPKEDLDVSEQLERSGCLELGIVQVFNHVLESRCAPFKPPAPAPHAHGSSSSSRAAGDAVGDGAAGSGGGAGGAAGAGSGAAGGAGEAGAAAAAPAAAAPLVVDVGANFGYFTVLAALMGCRVVAVEPVPRFLAFLHWNLAANGLRAANSTTDWGGGGSTTSASSSSASTPSASSSSASTPSAAPSAPAVVAVVAGAVSDAAGGNISIEAPRRGVWGTASVAGMIAGVQEDAKLERVTVPAVRLDELVPPGEVVLLMKVDVEGYEPVALRSAAGLLGLRQRG